MKYAGIPKTSYAETGRSDMKYPSVKSAKAIDERTILAEFSDNEIRKYDTALLRHLWKVNSGLNI